MLKWNGWFWKYVHSWNKRILIQRFEDHFHQIHYFSSEIISYKFAEQYTRLDIERHDEFDNRR